VENSPLNGADLLGLEGKDLPPGFRYYPPGAESTGKGDWVPGSDLKDCLLAAKIRYLRREQRALTHAVPYACIPGLNAALEAEHGAHVVHFADRAAESNIVMQLDEWACYVNWDPMHMPPNLKRLLEELRPKSDKRIN